MARQNRDLDKMIHELVVQLEQGLVLQKISCLGHTLGAAGASFTYTTCSSCLRFCFASSRICILSSQIQTKDWRFYNAYIVYRRSMLFLTLLWTLPLFSNEICWQPKSKALIYMNFQAKFCQQVINRILCVTLLLRALKTTPLRAYLIRLRFL